MRRRLYVMRHGAVSYFDAGRPLKPEDVPLTVAGRDQAYAAASMLRGIGFDRVITSGLPRTVDNGGNSGALAAKFRAVQNSRAAAAISKVRRWHSGRQLALEKQNFMVSG